MFSQDTGDNIAAFKVYKDPITEGKLGSDVLAKTKNSHNAAPLTDASNTVKHTRITSQKGDIMKIKAVNQEKIEKIEHSDVNELLTPSEGAGATEEDTIASKSADGDIHAAALSQHSDDVQERNILLNEEVKNVKEIADSPAPSNETASSAFQLDGADTSKTALANDDTTPRKSSIPSSADSQDFGEDIEFDNETLEKIHAIEKGLQCTSPSEKEPRSIPVLYDTSDEAEEDFGPEIDPLALESMEVKTMRSEEPQSANSPTPDTPVESYEEIKTWLEDFQDAGSMFDVDLDSQLLEDRHGENHTGPTDSILDSLLQSSELDTEKIMREVNNITAKYGGFTTGSKKPLATSLSTEAVANLFEKKSNKTIVNKKSSIRRTSRPLIPKKRPSFGGFVNARASSPLRASESAKRKAVKAFGQDGGLLYQINDKDPIEDAMKDTSTSDSVKTRKVTTDQ
ncbi:hypothetical protein VKS41_008981 [Umbelopsis sp. WA50703]